MEEILDSSRKAVLKKAVIQKYIFYGKSEHFCCLNGSQIHHLKNHSNTLASVIVVDSSMRNQEILSDTKGTEPITTQFVNEVSLKLQIWRLLRAKSSLTFRQTMGCRFTLKLVRDMIITYSQEILVSITVSRVRICDRTYKTEQNLTQNIKGMDLGNYISEILVSEAALQTCSLEKVF